MSHPLPLIGYLAKRRTRRPDWITAAAVSEVCSVSGCVAEPPPGWINRWAHNELWVYDTPDTALAAIADGDHEAFDLFAYRIDPTLYRGGNAVAFDLPAIAPAPLPDGFVALGFDAVSRSVGTTFECSPLSCCNLAEEFGANEWCLFDTQDKATSAALRWSVSSPEPGPYVVVEVLRQALNLGFAPPVSSGPARQTGGIVPSPIAAPSTSGRVSRESGSRGMGVSTRNSEQRCVDHARQPEHPHRARVERRDTHAVGTAIGRGFCPSLPPAATMPASPRGRAAADLPPHEHARPG